MVRISLVNQEDAPSWSEVEKYFGTLRRHYTSDRSGLRPDEIPGREEKCTALVFEDIGTTGLLGDTEEWREPAEDSRNDFFNFFRAEALTHKSPGDRGSRGVGKATFIQASRIKTLFGLTIRHNDPRPLLMGRSVLRSHRIGAVDHHGDGYFGNRSSCSPGLVVPIEDSGFIDDFTRTFRLERRRESGLSVVVPWLNEEIDEATVLRAVCENYFFTILNGGLDVWLELPGAKVILDGKSLVQEIRKWSGLERTIPIAELAEWATQGKAQSERHILFSHPETGAYRWSKDLFPEGLLDALREKLEQQERFTIRVLVPVRKHGVAAQPSYFDVYVTRDDSDYEFGLAFIREDILIADVRPRRVRNSIRALVVISDEPLAAFLRQAENPSHTQWQKNRVRKDYVHASSLVDFIVNSVGEICDLATAENREEDKRLLADVFPVPDGEKDPPDDNGGPPPSSPSYVRISSVSRGFSVTAGRHPLRVGDRVEVKAAYARSRGNAFARYRPTDFQIDQNPISLDSRGVEFTESADNRLVAKITDPQFRISVTGFDDNRDIRVVANKIGDTDASQSD